MNKHPLLFWQPKKDLLRLLSSFGFGRIMLIVLNYTIWVFFIFLSYQLIKTDINIFWQLFLATLLAEYLEKIIKKNIFWRRPMFLRHDKTPAGLVDSWYCTGSFPSGHAIKTFFFLFFLIQYSVFSLPIFFAIVLPLLFFRVLVGFHYPIDILGGAIIGFLIWLPSHFIVFSSNINQYLEIIFKTVFFIK